MSQKPSRHQAREVALQILYRYDGYTPSTDPSQASAQTSAQASAQGAPPAEVAPAPVPGRSVNEVINELNHHFDHFGVAQELRSFAAELVAGTLREISTLDALLEQHASHWKVARMGIVDRNLLRMAIYELSHFSDTPVSVVIDEAIELAKEFGTAESPAFINGVLDSVKNVVRATAPAS